MIIYQKRNKIDSKRLKTFNYNFAKHRVELLSVQEEKCLTKMGKKNAQVPFCFRCLTYWVQL